MIDNSKTSQPTDRDSTKALARNRRYGICSKASRMHAAAYDLTFHSAQPSADRFWKRRFRPLKCPEQHLRCVVLGGLKIRTGKGTARVYSKGSHEGSTTIFYRSSSERRGSTRGLRRPAGILLSRARELLNAAAEQALPTISGTFAAVFRGEASSADADERTELTDFADDVDDLLPAAGRRGYCSAPLIFWRTSRSTPGWCEVFATARRYPSRRQTWEAR